MAQSLELQKEKAPQFLQQAATVVHPSLQIQTNITAEQNLQLSLLVIPLCRARCIQRHLIKHERRSKDISRT